MGHIYLIAFVVLRLAQEIWVPKKVWRDLPLQQAIPSLGFAKPHPSKDPGLDPSVPKDSGVLWNRCCAQGCCGT